MMDQKLALKILLSGQSALLTGPAGSGKTYVLNDFIRRAKANGKKVAVTATTGLAATHLSGTTIHAWSGIGIHDELPARFMEGLSDSRRDTIYKADVLVIDEISMLHDYRLDLVDQVVRTVRGKDQPFGGMQVVLCGDFFQLPPVNRPGTRQGGFVINARAWQELKPVICYLSEQHRQDDSRLLTILTALRNGTIGETHLEDLHSRGNVELGDHTPITELYTTNIDVDRINQEQLARVPGDDHWFSMTTTGKESYVESLKRSCLATEELVLKRGALVMCIRNDPDKQYVNGSLGIVHDFELESGMPMVKLRSGRIITLKPETWELRDGDTKRASLTQLPLRLAWAITVHKSQGMTLDAARIDLSRAFVEGMGYVALSRVRSLETLSLAGLNQMALRVSAEARAIDEQLRGYSTAAAHQFADLPDIEEEKAAKQKSTKPGSWNERLELMRRQYPNAYKPWEPEQDLKLRYLFTAGSGLKELTNFFGRHPGSIKARLKKHFGEDIVIPR